jgi:hypothetical protein
MNILESILQSLRDAALYNQHELAAPRVVLWPDEERLWAKCIDALRERYMALWTLGDYAPDKMTGPAVWLRYQLETQSGGDIPVMYLPGIGRADFRNADQCPGQAKHLFALQFQGQFWTQKNGKDWTPFACLSSADGGLGLDVAADQDTRRAIQECLPALLDVEVDELRERRLEASDFRAIIIKDPARTLLRWIGNPSKIQLELQKSGSEWATFCAVCWNVYHFDPEKDGAIIAAEKLTSAKGEWVQVWKCYKDAPHAYPGVKEVLDLLPLPQQRLFGPVSEYLPRSNQDMEEHLERALLDLASVPPKQATATIQNLATEHAYRSTWVWATLGYSPLARAIGHLRDLAEIVQSSGSPTTWEALADYYTTTGWKADRSVIQALAAAKTAASTKAVTTAVRAIYLPWLDKFAVLTQALASSYPTSGPQACRTLSVEQGTLYLFVDGLRMDLARALEERLMTSGLDVTLSHSWSALPSVTATAKPAWMPLAGLLGGPLEGQGYQPQEHSTGKLLAHARFKQLVAELGITFLEPNELELPTGCAWTEFGSFDSTGHKQGAKLAWRVDEELVGLEQHISDLLRAGWAHVKVVTDHGWLLLPGGLPKADLPRHLTGSIWGRCAIPAHGAQHGYPQTSWFWDAAEAVVLAPGISCFVAGMEYAHGGLTLQEALMPSLTVSTKHTNAAKPVAVTSLKWSGMRLNVVLQGAEGLDVDIRSKVADPATSFIENPVMGSADGQKTSLLIADDDSLGAAAFLVVMDQNNQPVFKQSIVIGED